MKRLDPAVVIIGFLGVLVAGGCAYGMATNSADTGDDGLFFGLALGLGMVVVAVWKYNQDAQHHEDTSAAAGWKPDPTGRFERRFWDGQRWTEHVQSAGQPATDPI